MSQKNVLVLFGGVSPEHEISMASAAFVINTLGSHNVVPVHITQEGKWLLYDGKLDNIQNIDWKKFGTPAILSPDRVNRGLMRIVGDKVKMVPVDVVLPILHGVNGEDGTIQGLCELAGIPYIGCGVLASSVAMDKAAMKLIAKALKIPQTDYLTITSSEFISKPKPFLKKVQTKLGYPCFVKPNVGGSSIGVSKATNQEELEEAIKLAMELCPKVVIEKAVIGREVEVGILGAGANAKASVVGEIVTDSGSAFYDYEAKYTNPASKTIVPADLPETIVKKIQKYALDLYNAIDGKGLSRVDFFVPESGDIIFNEINTVPGFTSISMYAKMWEASGISNDALVECLIEQALGDI